jgi:hypothetical protein
VEKSFEVLELLQSCLSTPENMEALKPQVEAKVTEMNGLTLRVKVIRQ